MPAGIIYAFIILIALRSWIGSTEGHITKESEDSALDALLEKVYRSGGYDFRDYRRSTIQRRLTRRLNATDTRTYPEYIQFLDRHTEEYQRLAEDITIKVSSFFRSRYTFQKVAETILPDLLSNKEIRNRPEISFWSAACARGEEPYSIAMLLQDLSGQRRAHLNISIYASDLSLWALSQAQAGKYSPGDVASLPPTLLTNYFIQHPQKYEVKPEIRNMVSFTHFDLASGGAPPFTGVDCIFCCNVLIYLQKQLQERVLAKLYDALATPGYLILGEVETPTIEIRRKLECLDDKARIYKKVNK